MPCRRLKPLPPHTIVSFLVISDQNKGTLARHSHSLHKKTPDRRSPLAACLEPPWAAALRLRAAARPRAVLAAATAGAPPAARALARRARLLRSPAAAGHAVAAGAGAVRPGSSAGSAPARAVVTLVAAVATRGATGTVVVTVAVTSARSRRVCSCGTSVRT